MFFKAKGKEILTKIISCLLCAYLLCDVLVVHDHKTHLPEKRHQISFVLFRTSSLFVVRKLDDVHDEGDATIARSHLIAHHIALMELNGMPDGGEGCRLRYVLGKNGQFDVTAVVCRRASGSVWSAGQKRSRESGLATFSKADFIPKDARCFGKHLIANSDQCEKGGRTTFL